MVRDLPPNIKVNTVVTRIKTHPYHNLMRKTSVNNSFWLRQLQATNANEAAHRLIVCKQTPTENTLYCVSLIFTKWSLKMTWPASVGEMALMHFPFSAQTKHIPLRRSPEFC